MAITQAHSRMVSDVDAGSTYLTSSSIGTSAPLNVGTSANNVVQLDGTAKLPAVDGSALTNVSAGKVLQVVNASIGTVLTGTTAMPNDNTIPQNTEGDEILTASITPANASNKLLIEFSTIAGGSAATWIGGALFQDSTANAIAATANYCPAAGGACALPFSHYMTAGTASATTFKIRIGIQGSGTVTINGNGGNQTMGGVGATTLTITEIAA